MTETRRVKLGGRLYREIELLTVERDQYLLGRAHRAGITEMVMEENETPSEFARRVLFGLMASGLALPILGGLFIEEGRKDTDWSPEMAEENSRFFGSLSTKEDREAVHGLTADLLLDFSAGGLISFWRTRSSSPEGQSA